MSFQWNDQESTSDMAKTDEEFLKNIQAKAEQARLWDNDENTNFWFLIFLFIFVIFICSLLAMWWQQTHARHKIYQDLGYRY